MKRATYVFTAMLIVSVLFNVLFVAFDLGGYALDKVENKYGYSISRARDAEAFEAEVVPASLSMMNAASLEMRGQQYNSTIVRVYSTYLSNTGKRYARYDYPTGFLLAGISDYSLVKRDNRIKQALEKRFSDYMFADGRPAFKLDHIDQAVFGVTAVNLYKMTGSGKYKIFADHVLNFVKSKVRADNGVIPYETTKKPLYLVDTLGMVCPFLVRYGKSFGSSEAIGIAARQIAFFEDHGVDRKSGLPFHQISSNGDIPLGPDNWGRGIGWYMYAVAEYHAATDRDDADILATSSTLDRLKTSQMVWSQFPGTTEHFDASPTVMILYSQSLSKATPVDRQAVFTLLNRYTSNGKLESTSGDTMGVNQYSALFGPSEVSQGFLMMLLARAG